MPNKCKTLPSGAGANCNLNFISLSRVRNIARVSLVGSIGFQLRSRWQLP